MISAFARESKAIEKEERPATVQAPEAAQPRYELMAGTNIQVVGIGQDYLRPGLPEFFRGHRLHGRLSSDRHEDRGINPSVGSCQRAEAGRRGAILFNYGKLKSGQIITGSDTIPTSESG